MRGFLALREQRGELWVSTICCNFFDWPKIDHGFGSPAPGSTAFFALEKYSGFNLAMERLDPPFMWRSRVFAGKKYSCRVATLKLQRFGIRYSAACKDDGCGQNAISKIDSGLL